MGTETYGTNRYITSERAFYQNFNARQRKEILMNIPAHYTDAKTNLISLGITVARSAALSQM